MPSTFEIKDLRPLRFFLGMEVARSKKGIDVSLQKYVLDLLKEIGMSGCRPVDTLIDPNQKLGDDKEGDGEYNSISKVGGKVDLPHIHGQILHLS